jgi:hypothetical protein
MSKSIRKDSPILHNAEELFELLSYLPVCSTPRIMADSMKHILNLADRFNAEFTAQGWVFVEFCCGYETATEALAMKKRGQDPAYIDGYLANNLINLEPLHIQAKKLLGEGVVAPLNPVRVEVVERAFRAYHEEDYIACVPLLLMLIDSFGVTKTGNKSIFSDLSESDELFVHEKSIGGHPSGLRAVLGHITQTKRGYSEELISLPLRNAILHGVRLNYGNKIVATKALCVLAAVIEWARDAAPPPRVEVGRSKWNANFLTNAFANLQSNSPEEALYSFQCAVNSNKHHEAVALIDYEPTITDLRSKLSEWRVLMDTVAITIVQKDGWEVFGAPNDSEQHARCKVELALRPAEDIIELRSEEVLHARRQAAMKEIGLKHVWQIGQSVLGIIRNRLSLH